MSEKKKTTRQSRPASERISLEKYSFVIVIVIGVAMAVSGFLNIFKWEFVYEFASWVQSICFALGMFVPIVLSYRAAKRKELGVFIVWVVLVVLMAFGLVSNIISLITL